jgi:hypothetical protein
MSSPKHLAEARPLLCLVAQSYALVFVAADARVQYAAIGELLVDTLQFSYHLEVCLLQPLVLV